MREHSDVSIDLVVPRSGGEPVHALVGTRVVGWQDMEDENGVQRRLFVFPDLCARTPDRWRLRFTLVDLQVSFSGHVFELFVSGLLRSSNAFRI